MWKMYDMEHLDGNESERSTKSNHSKDGVISQPSPDQCAPEFCSWKVNEKRQLEALIARLTLEEPSLIQDLPVNYCHKYSEQALPFSGEEMVPNRCKGPEKYVTDREMDFVQRERTVYGILSQDCLKTGQLTEHGFKSREISGEKKMECPYQNIVCTEAGLNQLTNNGSFYTENSEKPKTYFTEGTPHKISATTSLSDLMVLDCEAESLEVKSGLIPTTVQDSDYSIVDVPIPYKFKTETQEIKAVVLETPLMFSRCSSLDSINSCGQPSNFESSVVSEISQVTSGLMSPSELPDSPTQTITQCSHMSTNSSKEQNTEFEESTILKPDKRAVNCLIFGDGRSETITKNFPTIGSNLGDEVEEEHMLAACITFGMQCSQLKSIVGKSAPNSSVFRTQHISKIPSKALISIKTIDIPYSDATDCTTVYNTEDTPPLISNSTSQIDLSNLCALSDDSDQNILAECIQSGMPKAHTNFHKPTKTNSTDLK